MSISDFICAVFSFLLPTMRDSEAGSSQKKQTVVVVGGGVIGSLLTRELSRKLDPTKHNLVLIEARPFAIWLIAACRLTTTSEGRLEDRCFVPFDNLFVNGNGTYKRGKVVAIDIDQVKGDTPTRAVVLEDGERVDFDALVLATGSSYSGPVAFPDDSSQCLDHVQLWRNKFKDAEHICLVGGGGVAIELAGELKDTYPTKKVTIVHGQKFLLKAGDFPDQFREHVGAKLESRGIELVLGDYVASFPESGPGEIVLRSGSRFSADLVVPTYGPRPHTEFIGTSLGPDSLTTTGHVKIRATLQLQSHACAFALGDIIDFPEGKRATKGKAQINVIATNVISYLKDPGCRPWKEYKGSMEAIALTNGKNGGTAYLPILWGITLGDWFVSRAISRNLHIEAFRKMLGM